MVTCTYEREYAEAIWTPFEEGSLRWNYIVNPNSIAEDFFNDPESRLAAPQPNGERYQYTEEEWMTHWMILENQKRLIQAKWLVAIGEFPAVHPALDSLPKVFDGRSH